MCLRRIHCGRQEWASLQCRSRRRVCDFSGRQHTRTTRVPRRRKGNDMFAELLAGSLRQSVMLIVVARLPAFSGPCLELGVGKGRCDGVPPRFSCTVTPVLIVLQAERENVLGHTQTKSFLQLSSIWDQPVFAINQHWGLFCAFWSIGTGGVGQSLFTQLIA